MEWASCFPGETAPQALLAVLAMLLSFMVP